MRFVRGFFGFWYDFIVGDDWKIAAAVVVALTLGAIGVAASAGTLSILVPLIAVLVFAAFTIALVPDVRKRQNRRR